MENKNLAVIEEREVLGKEFRIYGTVDEPLFLAKDVAEWIDYSWTNSKKTARQVGKMLSTIDEEEKCKRILGCKNNTTQNKHGGLRENTEVWFLTEDGLYEVLMQSRKPIAKQFKKKVKTILKEIRTTGGYIAGEEQMNEDELLAKALLVAQNKILKRDKLIAEQQKQIEEMKPDAEFGKAIQESGGSIGSGAMCAILQQNDIKVGTKTLLKNLREWGYLSKRKGSDWNRPLPKWIELSWFEVRENIIKLPNGDEIKNCTTMFTGIGQKEILKLYKELHKEKVQEIATDHKN